jgi:hypothetical protein
MMLIKNLGRHRNLRGGAGGLAVGGSHDERVEEGLLQLKVERGRMRVPHPSGAG